MTHIVGFEVHNLSNRIRRTIQNSLGCDGGEITQVHDFVLDYLSAHQYEDVFQRDVEEHLSVRRSTVSRILQLMEKRGLIVRESVPQDGRLKKISLTEKAQRIHKSVEQARAEMEVRITQGISTADMAVFFRVLEQMQNNLE